MFDTQQTAYIEVFASLGLDRFVGRYHQHHRVNAARPREHVLDKTLVARHIDKTDTLAAGQSDMREAEIDRNTACLFLGQTVGIDSRERADQRGLPVVDMASGS